MCYNVVKGGEKMSIGNNIKNKRLENGFTLEYLAKKVGTSKQTIQRYETGVISNIPSDKIELLADALKTTPAFLMGWETAEKSKSSINFKAMPDNIIPLPKTKKLPLLGTIACGEPILAEENIEEYIETPEDIRATFCLRCKGDSMINARIYDGDIVYIREQLDVENGEIAAVLIDEEATLKRIYKYSDKVILQPENPIYEPLVFIKEEINTLKILGKAVAFTSTVR